MKRIWSWLFKKNPLQNLHGDELDIYIINTLEKFPLNTPAKLKDISKVTGIPAHQIRRGVCYGGGWCHLVNWRNVYIDNKTYIERFFDRKPLILPQSASSTVVVNAQRPGYDIT